MPVIAQGVRQSGAEFYWHLGDFRAIYTFDEDMVPPPQLGLSTKPMTISQYESAAWADFLAHQIAPFRDLLEKKLTPTNVARVHTLRELALDPGDDPRIEAQPLYAPQLEVANGAHDVLIVSTMANNVYAFDVNTGAKLWKRNLGRPISPNRRAHFRPA